MKKFALALFVGAVGVMLTTTAVQAQGISPDHLLCYKVQDPLKLPTPNTLDLQAVLQPEFSQKGCTLVKPVEFCVPAAKEKVNPVPPNPSIVGQPLQDDYICYTMKCPDAVRPTSKQITDQFGQRLDLIVKPLTICVPATKVPLGCPTASGTTRAACGGPCPDPTQQCTWNKKHKSCECTTTPPPCAKPDRLGACGGDCSATPNTVCQPSVDATGKKICACLPPPQPGCSIDPATGTCGGTCATDPTKKCELVAGECTCAGVSQRCEGPVGPNGCGGSCQLPGQQCHPDSTGICTCASTCGQNPLTGKCSGDCTPGTNLTCQLTSDGCQCLPPACGFDAAGNCTGSCAAGTCHVDASGACNCQPAPTPCGSALAQSVPPACSSGFCPAGTSCTFFNNPTTGAPSCGCVIPTQ